MKGIEKGKIEEKRQVVFKMYKRDYPIEEIAEVTGLTIDEIKEIIKNER